jgi:hypothetical protein
VDELDIRRGGQGHEAEAEDGMLRLRLETPAEISPGDYHIEFT